MIAKTQPRDKVRERAIDRLLNDYEAAVLERERNHGAMRGELACEIADIRAAIRDMVR